MIKFISFLAMVLLLSLTPNPKPQEKEYIIKGTIPEYQILFSNQDDVSKNSRDKVIQKFIAQLNAQIAIDSTKKK